MSAPTLPFLPFSEVLAPELGWRVDCAVLATYSADLSIVAHAILALAGRFADHDDDASRLDLVQAMDELCGHVRIVAQKGRVNVTGTRPRLVGILDRFVAEVCTDERTYSWHPKAALVRFVPESGESGGARWRLWIGSRNLTKSNYWESGLVLTGMLGGRGRPVDGLAVLGRRLFEYAALDGHSPAALEKELLGMVWEFPPGVKEVRQIRFWGDGVGGRKPFIPPQARELWIVSPFLDKQIIGAAVTWGSAGIKRRLYSTKQELDKLPEDLLKPPFFEQVSVFDLPDLTAEPAEPVDREASGQPAVNQPEALAAKGEDVPPEGLHAKLIFAGSRAGGTIWLGSANATNRAWSGKNVEIIAELGVGEKTVEGLREHLKGARNYVREAGAGPAPETAEERKLKNARDELCATWSLRQSLTQASIQLSATGLPAFVHSDQELRLDVASFAGAWLAWPRGESSISLGQVPLDRRTEFVRVRLGCGVQECEWIELARFEVPLDFERDRAAIAQSLSARAFLEWTLGLLNPLRKPAGGDPWYKPDDDEASAPELAVANSSARFEPPTLEMILHSWARDRSQFSEATRRIREYAPAFEARAIEAGAETDAKEIANLRVLWAMLAAELDGATT